MTMGPSAIRFSAPKVRGRKENKKVMISKRETGVVHMPPQKRISDMSICTGEQMAVKQLVKGQLWTIDANYDFDLYGGMKGDNGLWEKVMGVGCVYFKKPAA